MTATLSLIPGGVATPLGFRAAGVSAGIKASGNPDLMLLVADAPVQVDTELLQEVAAFLHSRRQMVEDMASALAAGNRNGLRTVAHRAAGGLALFGFQWAAWQSRQISAAASEGEAGVLSQGIVRLREHLRDVQVV